MGNYNVEVKEASIKLSAKQRIAIKDTTSCIKLDEATKDEPLTIYPSFWAILNVHNEKSDNPDYENYVIVDKEGMRYVTGSASFWSSFIDIFKEMENEDEEWGIKIYRVESKNYKGKTFITCTIV